MSIVSLQDDNLVEVEVFPFVSEWMIIVTVIALVMELGTIVLRFLLSGLATRYFSQNYNIYGVVVRI